MDRMVYLAMTGAKQTMLAQRLVSHNLANASTVGFRADLAAFESRDVLGPGYPSRVNAVAQHRGWDTHMGHIEPTGRPLDVAIQGEGWIAVQTGDGSEAYTRAGDLHLTPLGLLTTGAGHLVKGNKGPVAVAKPQNVEIGSDGSISVIPEGQQPNTVSIVDRIKLVNPPREELVKGDDGLFRRADGQETKPDANVRIKSGNLESSNVNVAEALVSMIELARRFELQVRAMTTAERNHQAATRMLQLG
jgi:flagellar basal-body rod protein FlgF